MVYKYTRAKNNIITNNNNDDTNLYKDSYIILHTNSLAYTIQKNVSNLNKK